jgi:hypothetical protein
LYIYIEPVLASHTEFYEKDLVSLRDQMKIVEGWKKKFVNISQVCDVSVVDGNNNNKRKDMEVDTSDVAPQQSDDDSEDDDDDDSTEYLHCSNTDAAQRTRSSSNNSDVEREDLFNTGRVLAEKQCCTIQLRNMSYSQHGGLHPSHWVTSN